MFRHAVWLLCLCLALQGLALSAQRGQGRAHHHVDPVSAKDAHDPWQETEHVVHVAEPWVASVIATAHHHQHAGVEQHEHDPSDLTAVYAHADEAHHASSHATTLRSVLELESLPTQGSSPTDVPQAAFWPSRALIHVRSHITGPLDRPPRA